VSSPCASGNAAATAAPRGCIERIEVVVRLRPVLALLLLGLVTTACGGSTESAGPQASESSPASIVRAASERVVEDGSSRVALDVATSASGLDLKVTGEGLIDYAAETAEFTVTLPGTEQELTLRLVSGALFVTGIPGGPPDQWVRVDPADLGGSGLGDLGSFTDPSSSFDQLRAVSDDVTEVGSQDVRGTQTTHYRGSVLLTDVVEQAPADRREAVQKQLRPLQDAGVESLPFEAFIDDEGRLRRMVQTLTLDPSALGGAPPAEPGTPSGQPSAAPVEVVTTIDVFDFGVAVDVQEPPADQVTEGPEGLLGQAPAAPKPA